MDRGRPLFLGSAGFRDMEWLACSDFCYLLVHERAQPWYVERNMVRTKKARSTAGRSLVPAFQSFSKRGARTSSSAYCSTLSGCLASFGDRYILRNQFSAS